MKKEYAVVVYQVETHDGEQWCAEFPDIKGCGGGGNTAEEAITEAYDNLAFHLESLKEQGIVIPEPTYKQSNNYSGKLVVRMSKSLHKKVSEYALEEGVSINTFIVEAIAEKTGEQKHSKLLNKVYELSWRTMTNLNNKVQKQHKISNSFSWGAEYNTYNKMEA